MRHQASATSPLHSESKLEIMPVAGTDPSAEPLPKVSIITVSFNSISTIRQTIESTLQQDYPNIEYIVVDGASTDGTEQVVREYGERIAVVVSEADSGIYDAMNKGIRLATGEIIGFINSDDYYPAPDVVSRGVRAISQSEAQACYGDLCYVGSNNQVVRYWRSSAFRKGRFRDGWCPPHPTFLARREVYDRYGMFDLQYRIAADIELMMRFLEVYRIKTVYLPEIMVHMRMGGVTNRNPLNILRQNIEILSALRKHGLRPSVPRLIWKKLADRGMQFLVRP